MRYIVCAMITQQVTACKPQLLYMNSFLHVYICNRLVQGIFVHNFDAKESGLLLSSFVVLFLMVESESIKVQKESIIHYNFASFFGLYAGPDHGPSGP